MIVSPSIQTMIPRRKSRYSRSFTGRKTASIRLPGGKMLWYGVAKASLVAVLFLSVASIWSTHSSKRMNVQLGQAEALQNELINTNIILRAQKAQLFSPQTVERLAGQQLALQLPGSGQYRKF